MELDTLRGLRWSHDAADQGLQPMEKRTCQLWNILPSATTIFHHKEEGPDLPQDTVLKAPHRRDCKMEEEIESFCSWTTTNTCMTGCLAKPSETGTA